MKNTELYFMIGTVLSITLGTVGNGVVFASPATVEGGDTGDDGSTDEPETPEEPEQPEQPAEPEPTPGSEEPIAPEPPREPSVICIPEDEECKVKQPKPPVPSPEEPLPYCDTPEGEAAPGCHDRYDYDENTGLYPCNDGSTATDPLKCKDATLPLDPKLCPNGSLSPDGRCIPDPNCENPYAPDCKLPPCEPGFAYTWGCKEPKPPKPPIKPCDPVTDTNCEPIGPRCKDGFKLVDGKCVKKNGNGGGGDGTGRGGGGTQASGSGPINMVPKPGQAVVKIFYEDAWSGSVSDGNFDSASYDGSGTSSIAFDCGSGDIYAVTIQKGEDNNDVMTLIVEDHTKKVLDQSQTSAEFGVVSLSGTC